MTRRYPGKAVDASLSLEQPNAMDTIYRNNWLNAHESIRTAPTVVVTTGTLKGHDSDLGYYPSDKNGSVSSLGKYQMTLEQIRLLDLQHKDPSVTQAIKDLSGYKPSTLRRKNRRHYPGWDDLIDTQPKSGERDLDIDQLSVYDDNHFDSHRGPTSQTNSNGTRSPAYANVTSSTKQLKRSQTMRESNQTPPMFCSTLDIKDMFRRRPSPNDISPIPCDRTPTRRRHTGSSGSNSNASSSSASSSKKSSAEQQLLITVQPNCDSNNTTGHPNVDGQFRASMYGEGSDEETSPPPIEVQPKYSRDPSTRMRKASGRPSRSTDPWSADASKTVQRAKSVRIQNDHQVIIDNDSNVVLRPSPPIASPRNAKFNTIAIRNNHYERPPASELHQQQPQRSINPQRTLSSILKTPSPSISVNDISPSPTTNNSSPAAAGLQLPPSRRNAASSSSVDSDELFSIPRPRLIVPVHTYARKRRTGNLLGAVADEAEDDCSTTPAVPVTNGKSIIIRAKFHFVFYAVFRVCVYVYIWFHHNSKTGPYTYIKSGLVSTYSPYITHHHHHQV